MSDRDDLIAELEKLQALLTQRQQECESAIIKAILEAEGTK